jgi:hypothetical protein
MPIDPANHDRLAALDDAFEIYWCSDWLDKSNLIGEAFGLPAFEHVELMGRIEDDPGGRRSARIDHKVRSVNRFIQQRAFGDRPFAWIDDDHCFRSHGFAGDVPTLLIQPIRDLGLTDPMVTDLIRFSQIAADDEPLVERCRKAAKIQADWPAVSQLHNVYPWSIMW